jgi:tRNA threonylcarbamoyladenosine modification (KEOPS) complex  Pcc1 subunit
MNEKSVRIWLEVAVEDTIAEVIYLETEENREKTSRLNFETEETRNSK